MSFLNCSSFIILGVPFVGLFSSKILLGGGLLIVFSRMLLKIFARPRQFRHQCRAIYSCPQYKDLVSLDGLDRVWLIPQKGNNLVLLWWGIALLSWPRLQGWTFAVSYGKHATCAGYECGICVYLKFLTTTWAGYVNYFTHAITCYSSS